MPIRINDLFDEDATYLTTAQQTPFEPVRNQAGLLTTLLIGINYFSLPVAGVVLAAFGSVYTIARVFKSRVDTLEEENPSEGAVNVVVARETKLGSKYLFFLPGLLIPFIIFRRRRKR